MINYLNNIFYGDYAFISWGIIIVMFGAGLAMELPAIIKAIKEKKNKK